MTKSEKCGCTFNGVSSRASSRMKLLASSISLFKIKVFIGAPHASRTSNVRSTESQRSQNKNQTRESLRLSTHDIHKRIILKNYYNYGYW